MWNKHGWCNGRERRREWFENHDSLQTVKSVNSERKNEIMKNNFKNIHVQRNKWKSHNGNATCWAFYCVNANKEVDVKFLEITKCIFCYTSPVLVSNIKTQARKD